MKRFLVPAVAGVAVFGAVTGFAATLNVNSDTLGSGEDVVASCNASADVAYTTSYDATDARYEVATADITSAATCNGFSYKVTLTGAAGSLGEVTGTLVADGSASADFSGEDASAEDVTGVAVVITG